jgi:hypothetical protein
MFNRMSGASLCACALLATLAVPGILLAQSTEGQRARVLKLEQAVREIPRKDRAPFPSPRATDTTRAGALVMTSEPELTPLAREVTPWAWRILTEYFGEVAAGSLGATGTVFVLEMREMGSGPRLVLGRVGKKTRAGGQTRGWGTVDGNPEDLSAHLAQNAANELASGLDLPSWASRFVLPNDRDRTLLANSFIALATSRDRAERECAAGGSNACERMLGLDRPELTARADAGERRHDQLRTRLLGIALRAGGSAAPGRLRASAGKNLGDRLAIAAGHSADSLFAIWRAELTQSPVSTTPTARSILAFVFISMLVPIVFLRRAGRR